MQEGFSVKKRVADIIMDTLAVYGVTDCFAVVGGGAMYLDHALGQCGEIKTYFNHHEQACAMAAEAYARYSGRMAAVCVTSGPGAVNALTGVVGAWQDSLPMIILSGQVRYKISVSASGLPLRYRGIQEFEIIPAVQNMTKYAVMLKDPLEVRKELVKAIHIAMEGRRGPVWIDIPQDIQNAEVEEELLYPAGEFYDNERQENNEEVEEILNILQQASRPCILAGSAIISSHTRTEFVKFAGWMQIPVIGGAWVSDVFYMEHALYYGLSGNIGPRTGNFIIQNADAILVLGNSLGFRQTGFNQSGFAPDAKILMVDADEYESRKPGLHIDKFLNSDLKSFFDIAGKTYVKLQKHEEWIKYCNYLKQTFTPFEAVRNLNKNERVCSYYFWKIFQQYEEDDSVLALGNNTASSAKLQIGTVKEEQRVITNYACGSMGYDLPAAIGAAIASKKKVYCLTGDGSIMMNLQEFQTIVQYNLPIKIVIFNNNGYAAIRQTSNNFFGGKYIGCTPESGVSFPDFKKVADVFGFEYINCSANKEVEDKLQQFFHTEKRVILEVMQALDDPVIPKVMSRLDKDGKMKSPVLHDMFPFLQKEEMEKLLLQ